MPEYAENIIVGIKNRSKFDWYILNKYVCLLDFSVLKQEDINLYMKNEKINKTRKNLITVNENNVDAYLNRIENEKISCEKLQLFILNSLQDIEKCNIDNFFPVLFFDFDKKILYSQYPEYFDFDRFLPNGWEFKYDDFTGLLEIENKYWLYKNRNMFAEETNLKEHFNKNKYSIKFKKTNNEKNNTDLIVYKEKNIFIKLIDFIKNIREISKKRN